MFLTPLPFSELICFISMFLTSIYLLVGTIGNIQVKEQVAGQDKIFTIQAETHVNLLNPAYIDLLIPIKQNQSNQQKFNRDQNQNGVKIITLSYRKVFPATVCLPIEGVISIFCTRGPPC